MALEGFQPYLVVAGSPSVSFSKNGVGISKAAVAKLCNSKFVRVLIDAKADGDPDLRRKRSVGDAICKI